MLETAEESIDAVKRVLDVTNACIASLVSKEEKFLATTGKPQKRYQQVREETQVYV
jgi:hypothetical protein